MYRISGSAGIAQSVQRLATCRRSGDRIPVGGGEIFPFPSRPALGPTEPPVNFPFPGVKWPRFDVDHPQPSSTDVKERVQTYLYSLLWAFVARYRSKFMFIHTESDSQAFHGRTHECMINIASWFRMCLCYHANWCFKGAELLHSENR